MNRIFVDMDGVIVDFDGYARKQGLSADEIKKRPGAYLRMEPIPDAIDAVRRLIGMGFEVWAATKPPTGIATAYSDKAAWIFEHLSELKRRLILAHDKGLLGDAGDYLIDDRPHRANCDRFSGTVIVFGDGNRWPDILEYFSHRLSSTKHWSNSLPFDTNPSMMPSHASRSPIAASPFNPDESEVDQRSLDNLQTKVENV